MKKQPHQRLFFLTEEVNQRGAQHRGNRRLRGVAGGGAQLRALRNEYDE
jgi:hypothetical protein